MALSHCLFSICFFVSCFASFTVAEFQKLHHPSSKNDRSISFLVVGDWGRQGSHNQSEVAFQMGRIGDKLDIDFVVSTGDNFYDNGLTGINDPAFEESFTKIYTSNSLQKQWYSVLGNHDYRGDVEAQLDPMLRKADRRWLCMRSFIVNAEMVEFFFVDTTPFVDQYFASPNIHTYDWRGVVPRKRYIANVLKDLESALKESKAKWKIVVGHHAIRSANDVDFYINGHDHCLEHISSNDSPLQFLTSGGGSKAWRGDAQGGNGDGVHLFYDGPGFMTTPCVVIFTVHIQRQVWDILQGNLILGDAACCERK
ncbi:hypothetical protein IFM89_039713 [Coptis chinensis]|uniref:Purple acid phosphatase n=1 Tax=Coptis chinensis TaxID=261450 RepID=A0A835GVQ8_9MAGN|nr:hypothetical protein IFM89_039713 [Coptis chinensis]